MRSKPSNTGSLLPDSDPLPCHAKTRSIFLRRIVGVSLQSPSIFTFFDPVNSVCVRVPLPQRSAAWCAVGAGRVRSSVGREGSSTASFVLLSRDGDAFNLEAMASNLLSMAPNLLT